MSKKIDHPGITQRFATERLQKLYQNLSIWLLCCAIMLRLFLPGLQVTVGENAIVWLFSWSGFVLMWLAHIAKSGHTWLSIRFLLALGCFGCMPFFSACWAVDPTAACEQGWIWASDIVLFIGFCHWLHDACIQRRLLSFLLACFSLEMIYSLYQYSIGLPVSRFFVAQHPQIMQELSIGQDTLQMFYIRLHSPYVFGHFPLTNSLSGYVILYLPILGAFVLYTWGNKLKQFYVMLFVFGFAALVLFFTGSRGGILSIALAIFFYAFWYTKHQYPKPMLWLCVVGIFIICGITSLMLYTHSLDAVGLGSLSMVMRIGYWTAGCAIFFKHAFLGIGIANFKHYYYTFKEPWVEEVNTAHNCFLQWTLETGIVGTLALLWLIYAIYSMRKQYIASAQSNAAANSQARQDQTAALTPDQQSKQRNAQEVASSPAQDKHPTRSNSFIALILYISAAFFSLTLLALWGRSFEWDTLEYWLQANIPWITGCLGVIPYFLFLCSVILWLICFIFFQTCHFTACIKKLQAGCAIGLIAFGFHNFLDMNWYVPALSQQGWLVLGIWLVIPGVEQKKYTIPTWTNALILVMTSCILLWMAFVGVPKRIELSYLQYEISQLQNALQNPQNPQEQIELALAYAERLDRAVELGPTDHELLSNQSLFQLRQIAHWIEKEKLYLQRLTPELENALYECRKPLETAIAQQPRSLPAFWGLANFWKEQADLYQKWGKTQSHLRTHALAQAYSIIQEAIALYPYKIPFLTFAGQIATMQGNLEQAIHWYTQALYASDLDYMSIPIAEKQKIKQTLAELRKSKAK